MKQEVATMVQNHRWMQFGSGLGSWVSEDSTCESRRFQVPNAGKHIFMQAVSVTTSGTCGTLVLVLSRDYQRSALEWCAFRPTNHFSAHLPSNPVPKQTQLPLWSLAWALQWHVLLINVFEAVEYQRHKSAVVLYGRTVLVCRYTNTNQPWSTAPARRTQLNGHRAFPKWMAVKASPPSTCRDLIDSHESRMNPTSI